jgi:single-strand DNA-binding protein
MSNEIRTTIVGNLGKDAPELRFTPNGVPVCRFSVANTPRKREGDKFVDGEPTWVNVTAWRSLAQNVAESISAGDRVIVTGTLENRKWEDKEGNTRYSLDMTAEAVGPDLTWATAKPAKGVHDGAKERKATASREDPFESAATQRPAAGAAPANAEQQRAAQTAGAATDAPW